MDEVHTNAFVLRARSFAESDRIVVLLTEELGKISAIAKGARRSKRRFAGGALEPFQEVVARVSRKPHAQLAFLHECRVVAPNAAIAQRIEAFAWASYLTELTELMTPERDPAADIYDLYRRVVLRLANEPPEPLAHHFVLALLDHAGWAPDFGRCGICAEEVTEYTRPILDHRGSGVVCAKHEAESLGLDSTDPGFRPSRRVIEPPLMDYVRAAAGQVAAAPDAETRDLATRLLDRLVDLHLSKPPRSRAFLNTLADEAGAAKEPEPL